MKTIPTTDDLPDEIAKELAQLNLLDDSELWQAAQTRLSEEEAAQMQTLVYKQQSVGLTRCEKHKAEKFLQQLTIGKL